MGVSIFCGYAAIAHFAEHPVFGTMYCVLFANFTLDYVLIYGRAFRTQALSKQAVSAAVAKIGAAKTSKILRPTQHKVLLRQFMSIPSLGIQVGNFQSLERTSTPTFLDFVFRNIVNILVAFG